MRLFFGLAFNKVVKLFMRTCIRKIHQVFGTVIVRNFVNMMHNFFRAKRASDNLFHYKSMLVNVLTFFRIPYKNIVKAFNYSAFPVRMFRAFLKRTRVSGVFTFVPRNLSFVSFRKSFALRYSALQTFVRRRLAFHRFPVAFRRTIFFIPRGYCRKLLFTAKTFFNDSFLSRLNTALVRAENGFRMFFVKKFFFADRTNFHISSFCFTVIIALALFSCQEAFSLTNTWPDNDARVDGSVDTMDDVDDFINKLSLDIHERILSSDAETVQIQTDWTAAGKTCADLGTVTTVDIDGGTIDGLSNGVILPSGAAFYMITGSCPAGTTDVTSTYTGRYIKINAIQGTTAGPILTGATASHTLAESEMPAHTHTYNVHSQNEDRGHTNMNLTAGSDPSPTSTDGTPSTNSTGSGGGHTHNLSAATTLEPKSVTMKLCQVD